VEEAGSRASAGTFPRQYLKLGRGRNPPPGSTVFRSGATRALRAARSRV